MDHVNEPAKCEVRSFTRAWDNRGYFKNWTVPEYAHTRFALKVWMGFCSNGPCECTLPAKVEVCSPLESVSEIIAIEVLGAVANPNVCYTGVLRKGGFSI